MMAHTLQSCCTTLGLISQRRNHTLAKLLLGLPLVVASAAFPQGSGQRSAVSGVGPASIRGIVVTPGGAPLSEAVKVTLKVLRGDQAVIYTDQQGRFEFGGLGPGGYTIEVDPDRDARFEITTEVISVLRNTPTFVTITIKEKQRENRSTGDKTISVAMLDQKVPSEAKREFDKATRLDSQGRTDESVNALRRALAIYPDYLMALNDLGARLLDLGQLTEAAQHLRAAIKIDPNAFNPQLNLGVVLVRQNEFGQALEILGKALSLEPSAPAAHLYAGIAAAGLNDSGRAEKELNSAYELGGHPYAVALIYLGRLYTKKGDREQAIKSLEAYLRDSPNDPNSAEVKKMIAALH